ncbi:MAG TPA: DUF5808 domain-containing protein [Vicinamibacterales bacterium]|nr:DUF5808 domain-containing protein [Vicinamibacterales bacterium]
MGTMLGFIALVAISSQLAPYLTRREIFFGVTVSRSFREGPLARKVSRRYAIEVWLLAVAAAAIVATSPMPFVSGTMLLGLSIGASVAFARAWTTVRPHATMPTMIREAAIGPREGLPGGIVGQLGPFIILLAATAYVALNWDNVPARFPTHWNLAGKADGWTVKSVPGVFRGLAIGFVACTALLFTSYAVLNWTRLPRVTGHDGQQYRRVRRINLLAQLVWAYLMAILLAWTTCVAMFSANARELRLPLVIRMAPFALLIIGTLLIRVMRRTAVLEGPPIGDTTPDSSWILGRLYFNRADPTLFVERRMGLGYTLNLGNPWSWLVLIMFVTGIAIPLLLVP